MVKVLKIYLLITVIFSGLNLNAQAEDYEKGQLFAQIKTGKMLLYQTAGPLNNDQYKEFGITGFSKAFKINEEPLNRIFLVTFTNTEKIDDLIQQLQTSGMYDYVEKVPRYTLHYTPNDLQSVQWHLNKIMAQNAWDIQKGKSSIVIGLVDDALDTAHQDLEPIVWRNKNEIRGNGIDDDGNGYTDDYIGWDFADNDNDPSSGSSLKHGTHCGGIAAAKTDNSTGIASIGFGCQLMIAKIGKAGYSYLFSPYQGVEYAIINKANVISMSWGGGGYSYTYQLIFDNAYKKGIVCVAAAGNSSTSITSFPAGYNHVIAVGSTTSGDVVSGFSNYGTWVDVMAPGSGIYSTLPGNSYGNLSGTSMACPLVSGLCALMLSKNPNASPDEIEKCLKSGCDNINSNNSGFIGQMGAGRINAENSLKCMKPITADFTSNFTRICQGDTIQFFDKSSPTPAAIKWIFQGGTPATSLLTNPKVRYASNGIYDVQLIAFGNNFSDTIIRKQYVTVSKPTAILSGIRTIFEGNSTTIQVDFTGNAPWSVTYSDGTISTTLNNITVTPYYISVKPIVNTNYTLTAMSDRGCSGIISGAASVNVKKASNNCSNALKYQLSLGGALDDFGYDISEDANNNVYVSGNTLNYGNGDGYFAKFNSDGNLVWFKTYGGSANDVIYKHMQTPDKGALLIGFTYSYGAGSQDVMIIKVDTSGTVQWSKTVGGSGDDWGWNAAVTSDGGYYVYGATTTYGAGDFDNYLIKIDKNGNLKWTKTYGNSYYSTMSGLATFDDGSAVFCSNYRTSTSGDNLVAKIDSVGNLVWSKRFGGSFNDAPYKLTKGNDNNIYVVGAERTSSTNQEMFVACFTPSGNTKWIKSINGAGNESFYSVEPDGDDIIISGFTDTYGNGLSDISMIKMDTSGNILFSKTIGGTKEEVSLSLIKSTDGAYYSAGHTKSFTNGNNDIFINKFNCTPIVGCNEKDYTPTTGNFNLPLSDENQSVSTGGTLNTQTISATKRSLGVTYQCKTTGSSSCLKVDNFTKISSTTPGFTGQLKDGDYFGQAVRNIGDFDGDGINDIAVGAQLDDDGGSNQGAIYLMMLNANGTIKSKQKISATQGGFTGSLSGHNFFGSSVARIKDLDGDGFDDIAVGQIYDNTGTTRAGAVWILFMKADGTVKSHQKIANGTGGFPSVLDADDNFGIDITDMGDIDGDGSTDIAVGAHLDDDGGTDRGAVYILYLKNDGTVKSYKKISATSGGFSGTLRNGDGFGYGLASKTGDFNNDGINDLLVGSRNDDDGGTDRGAVWFLYLNSSETVIGQKKLSSTSTGLSSKLNNSDYFGSGVEVVGDINNDNIDDILVSAPGDKDGATNAGAVWLLLMTKDYDINSTIKISKLSQQVINNQIDASDYMGWKVSFLNDIDNNGFKEIVTGAMLDDDGGTDRGAVYILNLSDSCKYKCINPGFQSKISGTQGGFTGSLDNSDRFGAGVNGIGDIDKDGVQDIAICADSDDDGGTNLGAIWIVLMNANGTVKSQSKISATQGGFSGNITNGLYFGIRIVPLGDLNSDGVPDIAVGHHYESSVTTRAGAVWILFLNADGTVKSHQKITSGVGGFAATLNADDKFGLGLENIGDFNGDGIVDLAVGAQDDADGGTAKGAFYLLYLNTNGTVKGYNKVSAASGSFSGPLATATRFGFSIVSPGDIDSDGVKDMLVGAKDDNDGGTYRGAIWSLFMNSNGTVKSYQKISAVSGNFFGLDNGDNLGQDMRCIGDLNNDGINEIVVSTPYDDDGGSDRGAVWILFLGNNGKIIKQIKISGTSNYLTGKIDNSDLFSYGLGVINDLNGDGYKEIVSGAMWDDDGGTDRGAVYIFNLKDTCSPPPAPNPICYLKVDFKFDVGCVGDTTVFTDLSSDSLPNTIIRRKWYFGDGKMADGKSVEKYRYKDTGTYQVKLVVNSSASAKCTDSITKSINVNNQFKLKGLPDDTICIGDSSQLGVVQISCGTAPYKYQWQPSAGLDRSDIVNPKAAPLGNTRYILIATDKNGLIIKDTIHVTIDSSCCKSLALFRTDRLFTCENDTIKIINESVVKQGVSYKWTVGTGGNYTSFNGQNPPPLVFKKAGTYAVKLVINDICNADTVSHNVYVLPPPKVNAGPDTFLCLSDTITIGEAGIGRNQYLWQPATGLSDPTDPSPKVIVNSAITYTLTMITEDGCRAYDTIHIGDFNQQKLNLGKDTALCDTMGLLLTSSIQAGSFIWNTGATTPTLRVKQSGLYWLEAKMKHCVIRDSIAIDVMSGQKFTLGNDTTLCNSEVLILNAALGNAKSYLWNDNSVLSTQTVKRPGGQYFVKIVTDCGTYSDTISVNYLDCECDLYFPNSFSPHSTGNVNDIFQPVVGYGCTPELYQLTIYDRWGGELFRTDDVNQGWNGLYKGKPLPPGPYVFVVTLKIPGKNKGEIFQKSGLILLID